MSTDLRRLQVMTKTHQLVSRIVVRIAMSTGTGGGGKTASLHEPNRNDSPSRLRYNLCANWLHTGVEFMNRLIEIRRQELLCRERASLDSKRRVFWLAEAEEWEQRALDEIATHFRECNPETTSSHTRALF